MWPLTSGGILSDIAKLGGFCRLVGQFMWHCVAVITAASFPDSTSKEPGTEDSRFQFFEEFALLQISFS